MEPEMRLMQTHMLQSPIELLLGRPQIKLWDFHRMQEEKWSVSQFVLPIK